MSEDRRKSERIHLQTKAQYLEENTQELEECFVVNVSSDGVGILLYPREPIHAGTKLNFIISIASKIFKETGTVVWFKKLQRNVSLNSALGVKLAMPDDKIKSDLYKYGCSNFLKSDKQWEEEKYFL
jgi:hypothetical protein